MASWVSPGSLCGRNGQFSICRELGEASLRSSLQAIGRPVIMTYGRCGAGEGVHSYPIFGDVVGFQASLAFIWQGLNEKPQKDLKRSLSQGQEINGKVLGN